MGVRDVRSDGPVPARARTGTDASPFSLPLHALRIAGKCALPLIAWFSAGQAVRFGLLYLGTEISHGDARQLRLVGDHRGADAHRHGVDDDHRGHAVVGTRRAWEIRARRATGEEDERYWVSMNRVAPAFAVIYLTWGFHVEDARDFVQTELRTHRRLLSDSSRQEHGLGAGTHHLTGVPFGLMAVAFLLRALLQKMVEWGDGKVWGLGTALSEFAFVFFGLNATFVLANVRPTGSRTALPVYRDLGRRRRRPRPSRGIPGWEAFGSGRWIWPYIVDGVFIPPHGPTVAVLVFGTYADDARTMLRDTRFEKGIDKLYSTHSITQKSVERITGGFQERWVRWPTPSGRR